MKIPFDPARTTPATPRIIQGARLLAALSVIWSGYAITDLMHSGAWGLTVAIAGDIGWITVLWAEANRVRIWGYTWPAAAAGWLIAGGVGTLLAIHGTQGPDGSAAQGAAGVFVIAVSKIVWLFALAADADPAALTDVQETKLADARRNQAYEAQLRSIALDGVEQTAAARIARIRADGRVTLAQDEVDFEVRLERHRMAGEIERNTPLALSGYVRQALPAPSGQPAFDEAAKQAIDVVQEMPPADSPSVCPDTVPDTSGQTDKEPDTASGHDEPEPDSTPLTSPDTHPDSPDPLSVLAEAASGPSDLVRSLAAHGVPKDALVSEAVRLRPDMVADSIRRTAKRLGEGPYL